MTGSKAARAKAGPLSLRTEAMTKGRQADSARRRQRVIAALSKAAADGTEISVSSIARAAAVDRTFLYRHRDLLGKIHAAEATPPAASDRVGPTVTRASLQADLLAACERAARLAARVHQLEHRLSQALGEQAWRESGLGAPADIDALNQKITHLEQQVTDLKLPARRTRRRPHRGTGCQPRAPWPSSTRRRAASDTPSASLHHTCGATPARQSSADLAKLRKRLACLVCTPREGSAAPRTPACATSPCTATPRTRSGPRSSPWPAS